MKIIFLKGSMMNRIEAENPNQGEPGGETICMGCLAEVYHSMKSILAMYEGIIVNCTAIPGEHKQALFKMSDNVIADFDNAIEDFEKIISEE
jgi:hypothetical protein